MGAPDCKWDLLPPTFLLKSKSFAIASLSGIVTIILLTLVHNPKSFTTRKDEGSTANLL